MTTFEEVVYKAKEMATAAGRKAMDVADLAKLKLKILDNEKAIDTTMQALGHLLFDSRVDGAELNEELVCELISQVKELEAANEDLRAQMDNTRGRKTCVCGAINAEDAVYCNKCGKAL
jgi:hypothetical protein